MPAGKRENKKEERKVIPSGRAFIQSSFNNTVVTLTDPEGTFLLGSSGTADLKGREKALHMRATGGFGCCKKGGELRLTPGGCFVKGPGSGREAAIRALQAPDWQFPVSKTSHLSRTMVSASQAKKSIRI